MTLSLGSEIYREEHGEVVARAVAYVDHRNMHIRSQRVAEILVDAAGKGEIEQLLHGLDSTKFATGNLSSLLESKPDTRQWRIGEAIAEDYLVSLRNCEFPWPGGRDLRNSSASDAGCDLVGFNKDDRIRFVFAEVKTSSQRRNPPSVMHGSGGLRDQIANLYEDKTVKDELVRYLAHRAKYASWRSKFREATGHYLVDSDDVLICGVLVRDTDPNSRDLTNAAESIASLLASSANVEFSAVHIPTPLFDEVKKNALGTTT